VEVRKVKSILAACVPADTTFPWRTSKDPYGLVMAELMLIRTNAKQVVPVWDRFMKRFPNVKSLARAQAEEVEDNLADIGLWWRSRRIHSLAVEVAREHRGRMPRRVEELSALLPTGGYVAKAAALQVAGRGDLPVDVGIARFLARFNGLVVPKDARRTPAVLKRAKKSGTWTRQEFYGLIDLVRTKCGPRTALCGECPLQRLCRYGTRKSRESALLNRVPTG